MTKKNRVVFVDQVRTLAVIMMIVGHSLDRFLGEPWRFGAIYQNYQFVRGLSSALFLTIAGFSFVIASFGHMKEYTFLSSRMVGRLKRIGFILFLGMLLQMPSATIWGMMQVTDPIRWEIFFSFNVLQNIGLGLLMLHGVLYVAKNERRFAGLIGLLTVSFFALAPVTYRPEVDAAIPMMFRGAVNLFHFSRFPMIPLTAFIFVGALFGIAYKQVEQTPNEGWLFGAAALVGLLLVIFEQYIRHGGLGGFFPYGTPGIKGPGNTFARLGCALLIICAIYLLSRIVVMIPRISRIISQSSLAIYFVHLMVIYGSSYQRGLFYRQAHNMAPWQAASFIVALVLSMYAMAKGLGLLKTKHEFHFICIRRIILLEILCIFLFLPYVSFWGVVFTLVASTAIIYRQWWMTHLWRRPNNPKKGVVN